MNVAIRNENRVIGRSKIDPKKFALYVACASMMMMFAAFTSAYIVRQAAGNWLEFRLPNIFFINTGIMLLSSAVLQASYISFKRQKAGLYRALLVMGFALGIAFIVMQYQGWLALANIGIELTGNPSGSFVYVISGVHAAHVVGGLGALLVALTYAFVLPVKPNRRRLLRFEMTLVYWHFVDLLWVYLIVFFILQQS